MNRPKIRQPVLLMRDMLGRFIKLRRILISKPRRMRVSRRPPVAVQLALF